MPCGCKNGFVPYTLSPVYEIGLTNSNTLAGQVRIIICCDLVDKNYTEVGNGMRSEPSSYEELVQCYFNDPDPTVKMFE